MIPQEILDNSQIIPYKGAVYYGDLDFTHGRVVGVSEYCMELFINAPVPHFMSTFIFFYLKNPLQENPITCSAYGPTLSVHPGQGRLIASFLRGDKNIKSLLIPLNNEKEEVDFLHEVAKNVTKFDDNIFEYKNQNHTGISTKKFEDYFYPTDVRLDYEDKKQKLLDKHLSNYYPIEFMFNDRKSIVVGSQENKQIKTKVLCKNPKGLFEFIAFCANRKFFDSKNYIIL